MPLSIPKLVNNLFTYAHYYSHQSLVIFYSIIIGSFAPLFLIVVPKIRKAMGYKDAPVVPLTYPSESLHDFVLLQLRPFQ